MTAKEIPPRRQPEAGTNVIELGRPKYLPSSIAAQVCVNCGTRFDLVPTQGRCRQCLAYLLHYRSSRFLREVRS